ncbi:MAG: BrnT family toxin [bacterium]|nr:BrnT family toxin [bacterium]
MVVLREPVEFEWDAGNSSKPQKHGLTLTETEEAFFDENKMIFADWKHSTVEPRITLLGKTKKGRLLNITYTSRARKVRIITARPVNRKEIPLYKKNA